MNDTPMTSNDQQSPVRVQPMVVPRYATSLESTLLALAHTGAVALLAAYDWKLATAYFLHTAAWVWRSPMIWKRHNAEVSGRRQDL